MTRSSLVVIVRQAEALAFHLAAAVGIAVPTAAAIAPACWQARRLRESCERELRADLARGIAAHVAAVPLERLERAVAEGLPKLRAERERWRNDE